MSKMTTQTGWLRSWIEKVLIQLKTDETRDWLQVYIADPVINYIADRLFPYLIITGILFAAMLIFIILTFSLLLMRTSPPHFSTVRHIGGVCEYCNHAIKSMNSMS